MPSAVSVKRGCGYRQEGGIYLTTPTGRNGQPIEYFLIDPPVRLDPALGVSPVGITLMEINGVNHVLDWVGSQHYPNVADFIEETRRYGLSRRIASSVDFSKLTRESRWIGIHARAYIENTDRYWNAVAEDTGRVCPRNLPVHGQPTPPPMCVQLYWHDLEDGEPVSKELSTLIDAGSKRSVRVTMPAFSYIGSRQPDYAEPLYTPAMFISLPIKGIEVIQSKSNLHVQNAAKASASGLPVSVEQE